MKLTRPWFYDDFVCTAASCSDNCCIGWEIDIDEAAMERFSHVGGAFGERLRAAVQHNGSCPTFAMREGERCALLRDDGLCELILHEGEDILCDICALHPRFFGWYNDIKEAGLGLCCEEVCRLMFSCRDKLTFVHGEIDEAGEDNCSIELLSYLTAARERLYDILQDRSRQLGSRLLSMTSFVRIIQQHIDDGELVLPDDISADSHSVSDVSAVIDALFRLYSEMESVGAPWDERLASMISHREQLSEKLGEFLSCQREELWRYEHIAVYFLYRHFLSGVFEGEIVSRGGLVCAAVLSCILLDELTWLEKGELTEWDRIVSLKLFSKQMEYSDENLDAIYDAVWENELLSPEVLAGCLLV